MKLPIENINQKINELGLIDSNGKPISFAKFKKLISTHQYGRGQRRLFIMYIYTHPRESLLAFYPPTTTKPKMLKIAYEYLVDTITTDIKQEYLDENIMWGCNGIPIAYGNLR